MKSRTLRLFGLLMLGSALGTIGCTSNSPYTPGPSGSNTSTVNLSAYATIGSSANFNYPSGIRIWNGGSIWVTDNASPGSLQEWNPLGFATTVITTYSSGQTFNYPWADGIDPVTGNIYVADGNSGTVGNERVEVFDSNGNFLTLFGSAQLASPSSEPEGVAISPSGRTAYVLGYQVPKVFVYSISGSGSSLAYAYQYSFGNTGSAAATLYQPYNIATDSSGNVWVTNYPKHSVVEYDASGNFLKALTATQLANPTDVALTADGKVYVTDYGNNDVVVFNSSGSVIGTFGQGILNQPQGIATDGSGNFYVADSNNSRLVFFH